MITPEQKGRFTIYVKEFYHEDYGIYPIASDEEIEIAIEEYFIHLEESDTMEWGGGDSIDREVVRTIIDENYSMFIP